MADGSNIANILRAIGAYREPDNAPASPRLGGDFLTPAWQAFENGGLPRQMPRQMRSPELRAQDPDPHVSAPALAELQRRMAAAQDTDAHSAYAPPEPVTWKEAGEKLLEFTGLPSVRRAAFHVGNSLINNENEWGDAAWEAGNAALMLAPAFEATRAMTAPAAAEARLGVMPPEAPPTPPPHYVGPNGMPIAPAQPFRNSLRYGSEDLADAAAMRSEPSPAPSVGAASAGRDDLLGANDRGLLPRLRGMAEGDASFDNTYPRRLESPRNPAGVAYTEGEPNLGFHANDDTLPGTATPQSLEAVSEPPAPTGLKIEHQGDNWRIVDYGNLTSDGRPRTVRVLPTGSRYQDARTAFDELRRTRSAPDAGAAMGEQTTRPPWPEGTFNDASGGNANLRGAPELAAAWRDDDAFRQAFEAISHDRSVSKTDVKALLDHFFPHNVWRNGATRADLLTTLRQMRNTDMLRQNRLAAMSGPLPEYQPHRGPGYQAPEYPEGRVTIDGLRRELDVSPNADANLGANGEGPVMYRGLNRPYDPADGGHYQTFTSSEADAHEYGSHVMAARLSRGRNLAINGGGNNFNSLSTAQLPPEVRANLHPSVGASATTDEVAHAARAAGYDSVTIKNVHDNRWGERPAANVPTRTIEVVFDTKNISPVRGFVPTRPSAEAATGKVRLSDADRALLAELDSPPANAPAEGARRPRQVFDATHGRDQFEIVRNPSERDLARLMRQPNGEHHALRFIMGENGDVYVADANYGTHTSMATELYRFGEEVPFSKKVATHGQGFIDRQGIGGPLYVNATEGAQRTLDDILRRTSHTPNGGPSAGGREARRLGDNEPEGIFGAPASNIPPVGRSSGVRGMRAAVRDPETGRIYAGANHAEALDNALEEGGEAVYERALKAASADDNARGFVTPEGQFITREEGLVRLGRAARTSGERSTSPSATIKGQPELNRTATGTSEQPTTAARLSPDQSYILKRVGEGASTAEIAAEMRTTPNTVRVQISHARKKLASSGSDGPASRRSGRPPGWGAATIEQLTSRRAEILAQNASAGPRRQVTNISRHIADELGLAEDTVRSRLWAFDKAAKGSATTSDAATPDVAKDTYKNILGIQEEPARPSMRSKSDPDLAALAPLILSPALIAALQAYANPNGQQQ